MVGTSSVSILVFFIQFGASHTAGSSQQPLQIIWRDMVIHYLHIRFFRNQIEARNTIFGVANVGWSLMLHSWRISLHSKLYKLTKWIVSDESVPAVSGIWLAVKEMQIPVLALGARPCHDSEIWG
jgi:hypothetical protein